MGSAVRTSAGTTISISNAAVASNFANDAAAFGGLAWTAIGEVSDIGSFGKKYNLATFTGLGDRKVVKRKASYNNGTMSVKMGSAPLEPGQVKLTSAAGSDSSFGFKVVTQSGSIYYFTAQVMSFVLEIGSVDQIMGATAELEIDNDIVPVGLVA